MLLTTLYLETAAVPIIMGDPGDFLLLQCKDDLTLLATP